MRLNEKCGVFGAYSEKEDVFPYLYWGMLAQNHRGHQSHGFATFSNGTALKGRELAKKKNLTVDELINMLMKPTSKGV